MDRTYTLAQIHMYYWMDFSLLRRYGPPAGPRLEMPAFCCDGSAPEHFGPLCVAPCDPTLIDVYFLGNLIWACFLKVSTHALVFV